MGDRLRGKVALITGGAGGIGRVAAELFAAEGARVAVVDLAEDAGAECVKAIEGGGGEAVFVRADVSSAPEAEAAVDDTVAAFGRLDVVYNNAAIFPPDDAGPVDTPEDVFDRVLTVNVKGVWLCCKYGIPALLASGGGSIVNVASFVALVGAAVPQIAYTASKGAVLAMTREIAVQYARQGIRANALCPGPVETPMMQALLADPERRARRLVHIPLGRFGRAEEVARAALFLASDESSLMTGAALVVDGGITAAYITPEES